MSNDESLVNSRSRRINAGTRLKQLIELEEQASNDQAQVSQFVADDDDVDLLFKEDVDDEEFNGSESYSEDEDGDEDEEDNDEEETNKETKSNEHTDSQGEEDGDSEEGTPMVDSDDILSDSDVSSSETDESEGEKEYQSQERAVKRQQKKKQSLVPAIRRKTEESTQPKKKKKSSFSSEVLKSQRRSSSRTAVVENKAALVKRLEESERRRASANPVVRVEYHEPTQEEKLAEARETEKANLLSLSLFEEQEDERKEKQRQMMLSKRKKLRNVIRFVSEETFVTPLDEVIDARRAQEALLKAKKRPGRKRKTPVQPEINRLPGEIDTELPLVKEEMLRREKDREQKIRNGDLQPEDDNENPNPHDAEQLTNGVDSVQDNQQITNTKDISFDSYGDKGSSNGSSEIGDLHNDVQNSDSQDLQNNQTKDLANSSSSESKDDNHMDEQDNNDDSGPLSSESKDDNHMDEQDNNDDSGPSSSESKDDNHMDEQDNNDDSGPDSVEIKSEADASSLIDSGIQTGNSEDSKEAQKVNDSISKSSWKEDISDDDANERISVECGSTLPEVKEVDEKKNLVHKEKKVTFADQVDGKMSDVETEDDRRSVTPTPYEGPQEVFEGPAQRVLKNKVYFVDFDESRTKLTDANIKVLIFGEQALLPASRRFKDLEPLMRIGKAENPYATVKEERNTFLEPASELKDDDPMFEELRKLPRLGIREEEVSEVEEDDKEEEFAISLKTEAPTGLYLPNGNKKICLASGTEVKYFDPSNGIPYSSVETYRFLKTIEQGNIPWYSMGSELNDYGPVDLYLGSRDGNVKHARGVPEGFDA